MGRAAGRKIKGHCKHLHPKLHLFGCVENSHFIIYEGWKYFVMTFSSMTLLSYDVPGNRNLLRWDKLHNEVSSHQDSSDSKRPARGSALSNRQIRSPFQYFLFLFSVLVYFINIGWSPVSPLCSWKSVFLNSKAPSTYFWILKSKTYKSKTEG